MERKNIYITVAIAGAVLVLASQAMATFGPLSTYENYVGVTLQEDINEDFPDSLIKEKKSKPQVGEAVAYKEKFGTPNHWYARAYVKFIFDVPSNIDVENASVRIPVTAGPFVLEHSLELELLPTEEWSYSGLWWDNQPKFLEPIDTEVIESGTGHTVVLEGEVDSSYMESMAGEGYASFVIRDVDEDVTSLDTSSTAFPKLDNSYLRFDYVESVGGQSGEEEAQPEKREGETPYSMYVMGIGIVMSILGGVGYVYER